MNEHIIKIEKRTPEEVNIELILMLHGLKEQINELRLMVESHARTIKAINKLEEMRFRRTYKECFDKESE